MHITFQNNAPKILDKQTAIFHQTFDLKKTARRFSESNLDLGVDGNDRLQNEINCS